MVIYIWDTWETDNMFRYIPELMDNVTELSAEGNLDFSLIDGLNDLAVENDARLLFRQENNRIKSVYVCFGLKDTDNSSIDFFSEYFESPKRYWDCFPLPLLSL